MDICLERRADLHTAQLMPLPLTVTYFSKIQINEQQFADFAQYVEDWRCAIGRHLVGFGSVKLQNG